MAKRTPKKPDWFRIATEMFPAGPTLPFLLGAIRQARNEPPSSRAIGQKELREVLRLMDEEAPVGYAFYVRYCGPTGAHVVEPTLPGYDGKTLTWEDALSAATVDGLSGQLWAKYGDHIETGDSSKTPGGDWHPIDAADLARIEAIIGRAE